MKFGSLLLAALSLVGIGFLASNPSTAFAAGVPGPIVDAGLPGLLLACAGLIALARRRRQRMD